MDRGTHILSKSHRGEAVYTGGQQVSYDVPPERQADREDCVWYAVCLDRAAHERPKSGAARCVCAPDCAKYLQERRRA